MKTLFVGMTSVAACLALAVTAHAQLTIEWDDVGINTTSPEVELHIRDGDDGNSDVEFRLDSTGANNDCYIDFYEGSSEAMSLHYSGSKNALIIEDLTPSFPNPDAPRVTFMRSGNVGVGTEEPNAALEVVGSGQNFTIRASESPGGYYAGRVEVGYNSVNDYGRIQVWDGDGAAGGYYGPRDLLLQTHGGNVAIGVQSPDYANFPTDAKMLYFGAGSGAPIATPGDVAGLYAAPLTVEGTVELWAFDESANVTQLTPHDPETNEWVFYSKNLKTGKVVKVNMERFIRKMEEITGEKFIEEWIEK